MERQELIKFLNEFGLWFELLRYHDGPCQSVMTNKIALKKNLSLDYLRITVCKYSFSSSSNLK